MINRVGTQLLAGASRISFDTTKYYYTRKGKTMSTQKSSTLSTRGLNNTVNRIESFEEGLYDMKFDVVIGNPPYNDGTSANNPIYQLFTKKVEEKMMPEYFCFVIQANWLTQTRGVGKVMRDALKKAGVYNITINGWDAFEHAKVRTCTVFCKKGYTGSITLSDRNKSVVISNFDEKILLIADATELMLLNKLKPSKEKKHNLKGISDKWGIGTSYKKEGFDIDPLNTLKIIPPNKTGYKLFATFDTENEAVSNKEKYSSFWRSKLVTYILLRTRTSTTLDNPQIEYVPNLFIDRIFTDTELYQIYNLSNAEITHIESHVKHLY